jgi:hypothetical protein
MSTEPAPRLELDQFLGEEAILARVKAFEGKEIPLVTLVASVESLVRVLTTLLALRGQNISALLLLTPASIPLNDDELDVVFAFLRDWDQLILQNFLSVCSDRLPPQVLNILRNESKIELKWFQEWQTAASDSRINKYPTLPWRSFIRKIVRENYKFVSAFLPLVKPETIETEGPKAAQLLKDFLDVKKKVVCVFPKKWGKA